MTEFLRAGWGCRPRVVTLRSNHHTTSARGTGHFLRFALSQPLSHTRTHRHTHSRTQRNTLLPSSLSLPSAVVPLRSLPLSPSTPPPLPFRLCPTQRPVFHPKVFVSSVQRRWKTFEAYLTERMYPTTRLPSSFSPPPLPLPPLLLLPSAVLAHVEENHAYTRKHVHTRARDRPESREQSSLLATYALVSHPHDRAGSLARGLRERAALDFVPFPFSRAV